MKSIIICIIFIIPFITTLNKKNQFLFLNEFSMKQNNKLFNDDLKLAQCHLDETTSPDEEDEKLVFVSATPHKKDNKFLAIGQGYGFSTYFFDFLDPLLQKPISEEFQKIWDEAFKIEVPKPSDYEDPYSLKRILKLTSDVPEKEMIEMIKQRRKEFNESIWEQSIDAPKLFSILNSWKWRVKKVSAEDKVQYLIDKYDYNGDGRLSKSEFIIMMINQNKKAVKLAQDKRCVNCLEKITEDIIDPIYENLRNCSLTGVSAERIWERMQHLNRMTDSYDLYGCTTESGNPRTSAVNDFVLKSMKKENPYLTKEQFRTGIFVGYWRRQVNDTHIFTDDEINLKKYRWVGGKDVNCDQLKMKFEEDA